jgi:hypothetical protein
VWRFKDLPDKLIGAFGQLESAWPVNGSVLVKDGIAYFAAGRSTFLDGGIFVYGVDVKTGRLIHDNHIYGPFNQETGFPATDQNTFKSDIFTTDGKLLYIRHMAFNPDLTVSEAPGVHLIPSAGFTDDTPQHRTYWTVGTKYNWTAVSGIDCDILAVDGNRYYGIQGFRTHRHSYFDPRKSGYKLIAGSLGAGGESSGENKKKNKALPAEVPVGKWDSDIPLTGKAIIKAGDTVFVAGTPMKFEGDPFEKYVESYEQRLGGVLWLASAKDGGKLAEYKLASAPAWDGMAAAAGRLYISGVDGSVTCFSER